RTDIRELPISIVVEQVVRLAGEPAGTTFHRYAAHLAKGRNRRSCFGTWLVLDVVMDISRDIEVKPAVAVVIAPGCTVRPVAQRHSSLFRNIGKGSVMIVVVKTVLAEVGYKNIWPAVIVVMKQGRVRRVFLAFKGVVGGAVHKVDIEPAIVVVVNKSDACSVRSQ